MAARKPAAVVGPSYVLVLENDVIVQFSPGLMHVGKPLRDWLGSVDGASLIMRYAAIPLDS